MRNWLASSMHRYLVLLVLLALASAQDFSEASRRSDFQQFIKIFTENYAYIDRAERPWETWGVRFSPAVDAAKSPEAYAGLIESALDELHDFHAEVRSRNPHRWLPVPTFADIWAEFRDKDAIVVAVRQGSDAHRAGIMPGNRILRIGTDPVAIAVSNRLTPAVDNKEPTARNWALLSVLTGRADEERHLTILDGDGQSRSLALPLQRRFDRSAGALSWTVIPDNIGLLRFNNSLGDQDTVGALDGAL